MVHLLNLVQLNKDIQYFKGLIFMTAFKMLNCVFHCICLHLT